MKYVTLNNGVKMPILGFGVFQIDDMKECEEAVYNALKAGDVYKRQVYDSRIFRI